MLSELSSDFNNFVRTPLLNIELDMVVPMYLNILLGVSLRHHTWLIEETHAIDELLAELYSQPGSASYNHPERLEVFEDHLSSLQRMNDLGRN